jgi:CheY-like chemotaxis protein
MDLHMPEMNGFEATEYIRNKMNSQIPIIALTADVTTADLNKCTAVGMNDYISKPLDERILYNKIIDLLKKPLLLLDTPVDAARSKYVDLTYLEKRTKDNMELLTEMIGLYLKQTPPLIKQLKQGLHNKDWDSVYTAAHKLIPSFSIMGIHQDFEDAAKKIQEYSGTRQHLGEIKELITKVENVCTGACKELEGKLMIKKSK